MLFMPRNAHTHTLELSADILANVRERAEEIEKENREKNAVSTQGLNDTPEQSLIRCISGYAGEAAVALHLGINPIRTGDHWQDKPDVGGFDVMTTKHPGGRLIFNKNHPLWSVKILVIDQSPTFHICGCYPCADAREHEEWFEVPRPGGDCWMVPQEFLLPVNSRPDVEAIGRNHYGDIRKFSAQWREELRRAGVRPPNA